MIRVPFLEVIDRTFEGKFYSQEDFDMKVFVPELRKVIEKYKIRYDPNVLIPDDDDLADRMPVSTLLASSMDATTTFDVPASSSEPEQSQPFELAFYPPMTNTLPDLPRKPEPDEMVVLNQGGNDWRPKGNCQTR